MVFKQLPNIKVNGPGEAIGGAYEEWPDAHGLTVTQADKVNTRFMQHFRAASAAR